MEQAQPVVYGGFWRRFLALFIDGLITLIPSVVLSVFIPFIGGLVVTLLYRPIFEASPLMSSPGKAMLGLIVIDEKTGARLTLKQAYIRYFASILSGFTLLIGYLMNLFTGKRQTLHDLIAEVVVVRKAAPDLNYFDVWLAETKKVFNRLWNGPEAIENNMQSQSATLNQESSQTKAVITNSNESHESSTAEIAKAIEDLHRLQLSGALTQEEYEAKKAELLKKI